MSFKKANSKNVKKGVYIEIPPPHTHTHTHFSFLYVSLETSIEGMVRWVILGVLGL